MKINWDLSSCLLVGDGRRTIPQGIGWSEKISDCFAIASWNVEKLKLNFIDLADTFRLYAKLQNFFGKGSSSIHLGNHPL
ncbi:hypothetical protein [Nostoc sp. FACHB-110]|uniref:hypothetical protein n=1 Tax=Nostoc sp. FACHB-110 TaxID=2692834 RepID=UPI0016872263|nr:hypothetical protein [Nostoc sp. FACHB-110]MBD2436631.1 hypothetical protein [Nostoc sp. FACHB-110]